MHTVFEGQKIYQIVRKDNGKLYGSPFTSKKTLESSIEILKKFNPTFSEEYKIAEWSIEFDFFVEIP